MSVRKTLVEAVTSAVGKTATVIPYQDSVDVLDRVLVMFKQMGLQPLPEAPRAAYRVNYVLTIVSPAIDAIKAEAELDDFVVRLVGDLDDLDWFAWDSADKVLFQGTNLAYDVTCWTIAQRQPTTPTRKVTP